jgi:hypothetical protein
MARKGVVAGKGAAHSLDLSGALLLAVTLGCLVHALVALPEPGWTAVAGLVAGVAFVRHERRTACPLIPPTALCGGFALIGAGFGTVMVAATHVVVRQAAAASAWVAGGLQQTAMKVGPTLGVAAATRLMGVGGAGWAMLVLAAVAATGATAGRALP